MACSQSRFTPRREIACDSRELFQKRRQHGSCKVYDNLAKPFRESIPDRLTFYLNDTMNATDFPCGCCGEDKPAFPSVYDGGLEKLVCQECAGDLRNAADALASEGIPPIHRGPYCGNSNG